jgi:type II secretory pathway pseudopilin PulG
MLSPSSPAQRGSSLLEAVVAAGLLATVLSAVLPLVTTATIRVAEARTDQLAAHLARQRLSQLQALTRARTPTGLLTDLQSRLDGAEPFTNGGPGLDPTGPGPLADSMEPWADWLDEHGRWNAAGVQPAPGARFRRRWGILAPGEDGCLRLWVEVVPLGPSRGDRVVHAGGVQCPWGEGQP